MAEGPPFLGVGLGRMTQGYRSNLRKTTDVSGDRVGYAMVGNTRRFIRIDTQHERLCNDSNVIRRVESTLNQILIAPLGSMYARLLDPTRLLIDRDPIEQGIKSRVIWSSKLMKSRTIKPDEEMVTTLVVCK